MQRAWGPEYPHDVPPTLVQSTDMGVPATHDWRVVPMHESTVWSASHCWPRTQPTM